MLNWEKFKSLSGLDADNFEKLCRSIVRRRYGRYGPLFERKNQPGVEFYIELNQDCTELGALNDKVGWQCKWFATRANGELTSASRAHILHSLTTTDKHVSDITRWILWTPFTLAKPDQDWFDNLRLNYSYQLDLWNAEDIESFLEGPALELRGTYFEELALTPEVLEKQHRESVAPIQKRWVREVHQQVDAEKEIRQFLGEPSAWGEFQHLGDTLSQLSVVIEQSSCEPDYADWSIELKRFSLVCSELSCFSEFFNNTISGEDMESIRSMLFHTQASLDNHIYALLRQIRKRNLPLAIELTNALAFITDIHKLLKDVLDCLSLSFVAILADAGGGKTQMAAEITGPQFDRSAGVLILGRKLHRGDTLDDLARDITFYGQNLPNFAALLAALDAAAYRDNCRLPLIIDGLNEAEVPQEWKMLLATALEQLKNYPNVLLVCTLRTGERKRYNYGVQHHISSENRETFAQMSLPEDCVCLECEGFGDSTREAVISYFHHYNIEADLTQIPEDFFNHPLNLRIFCEVTNRNPSKVVRVDRFPASITKLFNSQIEYAALRISELPNLEKKYNVTDVWKAMYHLGILLWESGKRSIPEEQFLLLLDQQGRAWGENIVNLLSQEGILFRDPSDAPYSFVLTPVYDRLGGYIIADALLKKNQSNLSADWVNDKYCLDMLFGDANDSHQLSQDIVHSLVALMPKVISKQFWMVVPDDYQSHLIDLSTLIDADDFCDETEEAYRQHILRCKIEAGTFLKLKRIRSSGNHPLNADFFSTLMNELSISDRDLSWSEFLRRHHDDVLKEIRSLEEYWKANSTVRTEGDRLRAKWMSWMLTSTCLDIRDFTTKALYWYGIGATNQLFEMTVSSLEINDLYVSERMLAASYGVVLSCINNREPLVDAESFIEQLYKNMFSESATFSTTHILAREYASKLIEWIAELSPETLTSEQLIDSKHSFQSMPRLSWDVKESESRVNRLESPFGMDFENYTIGRLVKGRRNYDYDNPDYKEIRAKILWRVEDLGWCSEKYSEIERKIESSSGHYYGRLNHAKTERYGKKYSWIAYYEIAGQLHDEEKLHGRFTVDIDPCFPSCAENIIDNSTYYLCPSVADVNKWVTNPLPPNLDEFTSIDTIDGVLGPWLLLNGHISEESKRLDRYFYAHTKAFLVDSDSMERLVFYYKNLEPDNISSPEIESSYYLYAGELYQSGLSTLNSETEFEVTVGSETKHVERPVVEYVKEDDGSFRMSFSGRKIEDIEVPKIERVNAYHTVAEYSWGSENSALPNINSTILSSILFEKLEINFDPSSLEYRDSEGNIATKCISRKGMAASNTRDLYYIRKDLMDELLTTEKLKLVWTTYGERRLARTENFHSSSDGAAWYANFSFFDFYKST